jgi:hypothetical protein
MGRGKAWTGRVIRAEQPRLVNLVVLVFMAAAIAVFLEGAGFWLGTALVCAATAYGAFGMLGGVEPRGVPVESLATPAAAAFATVSLTHAVGASLVAPLVLAAGGGLLVTSIVLEMRLLGPSDAAEPLRRQQLLLLTVLLAFLCFAGAAAAAYGGLLGSDAASSPDPGSSVAAQEASLVTFVLADAAIGFVLGYRLTATRVPTVRASAREAGTFAAAVGVAAALIRAIALPRVLAPALLALVFYVWGSYRAASRVERRSNAWLWEYLVLAGAAALAVAWNLLLR